MRKLLMTVLLAPAALALGACSEQTEQQASAAAESAGQDIEANAATAAAAIGEAADTAANRAGEVADDALAATDELGNKVEQKAAEVEASAHNESVAEAKAD